MYGLYDEIYTDGGLNFAILNHLDEIGLITFSQLTGFTNTRLPKVIKVYYHGTPINIQFAKDTDNKLDLGQVLLTQVGRELARISGSKPIPDFFDYVLKHWINHGGIVYSDWPKPSP
jgi:hypothetical protein